MKVSISFTLDINAEAWADSYGIKGSKAIRQDVREHAYHTVQQLFSENGLLNKD